MFSVAIAARAGRAMPERRGGRGRISCAS